VTELSSLESEEAGVDEGDLDIDNDLDRSQQHQSDVETELIVRTVRVSRSQAEPRLYCTCITTTRIVGVIY